MRVFRCCLRETVLSVFIRMLDGRVVGVQQLQSQTRGCSGWNKVTSAFVAVNLEQCFRRVCDGFEPRRRGWVGNDAFGFGCRNPTCGSPEAASSGRTGVSRAR